MVYETEWTISIEDIIRQYKCPGCSGDFSDNHTVRNNDTVTCSKCYRSFHVMYIKGYRQAYKDVNKVEVGDFVAVSRYAGFDYDSGDVRTGELIRKKNRLYYIEGVEQGYKYCRFISGRI